MRHLPMWMASYLICLLTKLTVVMYMYVQATYLRINLLFHRAC